MDCDESVVIMSAVRYMLESGSSSYGVGCVCDYLKKRKNDLTDSNKQVIERDILEYVKQFPGSPMNKYWLEVIEYFKN